MKACALLCVTLLAAGDAFQPPLTGAIQPAQFDFEQRRELDALLAQKKKTGTLLAGVGVAAAAGAYVAYTQGLIG